MFLALNGKPCAHKLYFQIEDRCLLLGAADGISFLISKSAVRAVRFITSCADLSSSPSAPHRILGMYWQTQYILAEFAVPSTNQNYDFLHNCFHHFELGK